MLPTPDLAPLENSKGTYLQATLNPSQTELNPPFTAADLDLASAARTNSIGEKDKYHEKHNSTSNTVNIDSDVKNQEGFRTADEEWALDERNPRNWSFWKKWRMAGVVSFYCFISPVSSSMMAPALPLIQEHYNISGDTITNMTLSIFLLAFALGPLVLSPLSEVYGRTWVLHLSNIFFLIFTLACAFAPNVTALILFRFLAGLGGSAPLAIGGGSIGDMFAERERATAMAVYTLGPLIGPSVGPVIGGFLADSIGFKWIFILIAIMAGAGAVLGITFLRETYAPVIRARLAKKQQLDVENSSLDSALADNKGNIMAILWINLSRPLVLLSTSFICFILSLYMALLYGYYYLMFATFPTLFSELYGFSTGLSGLAYLGPGVGFATSTFYGAYVADGIYHRLAAKNGGVGKPEMRIPAQIAASVIVPAGLFWYGWSAQAELQFMMPIVGSGIFCFGMMTAFLPIQLYLVDAFKYSASAIAAATFLRSIFGFAFPLFGEQMFNVLGNGPGYSLLAGLAIITGLPFPIWIYFYGEGIRARSKTNR